MTILRVPSLARRKSRSRKLYLDWQVSFCSSIRIWSMLKYDASSSSIMLKSVILNHSFYFFCFLTRFTFMTVNNDLKESQQNLPKPDLSNTVKGDFKIQVLVWWNSSFWVALLAISLKVIIENLKFGKCHTQGAWMKTPAVWPTVICMIASSHPRMTRPIPAFFGLNSEFSMFY